MTRTKSPFRPALRLEALEARDVPSAFGELDPTFGVGGIARTDVPSGFGFGRMSTVVDSAGRTVMLGDSIWGELCVARLNPDGSPDTTFGNGGAVKVGFGFPTYPGGVSVDPQGNVVATGEIYVAVDPNKPQTKLVAVRLTDAGARDAAFGNNGVAVIELPVAGTWFDPGESALDADGRLVVSGAVRTDLPPTPTTLGVVRLTTAGQLDPTFDGDGLRDIAGTLGSSDAIAVDSSGRIVVRGGADGDGPLAVVRLNSDGSSDTTFATGGVFTTGTSYAGFGDITTDAAGNVYVVAGGLGPTPAVMKLTADGTLDPTFTAAPLDFGNNRLGLWAKTSLQVLSDGRVVVATAEGGGWTGPNRAVLFLLDAGGQLDPSFNPNGPTPGVNMFWLGDPDVAGWVSGVDITPTGDIVVAGFSGEEAPMIAARLKGPGVVESPPVVQELSPAIPRPETGVSGRAARADVNADGVLDTITVTGPGVPVRVTVVNGIAGAVLISEYEPFGRDFLGGGSVTAADLDGDGWAEVVVTPNQGGGPRVVVFSLVQRTAPASTETVWLRANFFGIDDANFRGGARAALGDINGDGTPDLTVAAGFGGGPRAVVFDGKTVLLGDSVMPIAGGNGFYFVPNRTKLVSDFFAFTGDDIVNLRNGVFVSSGDINADGKAELVFGGGPGGSPRVFILDGAKLTAGDVAGAQSNPVANFIVAGEDTNRGGVRVGTRHADGDNVADLVAAVGADDPTRIRTYSGTDFTGGGEPTPFQELMGYPAEPGGVYIG